MAFEATLYKCSPPPPPFWRKIKLNDPNSKTRTNIFFLQNLSIDSFDIITIVMKSFGNIVIGIILRPRC